MVERKKSKNYSKLLNIEPKYSSKIAKAEMKPKILKNNIEIST
jgi:hypothetical protein